MGRVRLSVLVRILIFLRRCLVRNEGLQIQAQDEIILRPRKLLDLGLTETRINMHFGSKDDFICLFVFLLFISFDCFCSTLFCAFDELDPQEVDSKQKAGTPQEKRMASTIQPLLRDTKRVSTTLKIYAVLCGECWPLFLDRLLPTYLSILFSVFFVLTFLELIPAFLVKKRALCFALAFRCSAIVRLLTTLGAPLILPIMYLSGIRRIHRASRLFSKRTQRAPSLRKITNKVSHSKIQEIKATGAAMCSASEESIEECPLCETRFPTCPESPPSLKATKLWGSGDSYIGYGGENQSIVGGLLQLKGFTPQFTGTADTYMKDMIPYLNPVGSVFAWDEPVFKKEDQHLALDMNGTCDPPTALPDPMNIRASVSYYYDTTSSLLLHS